MNRIFLILLCLVQLSFSVYSENGWYLSDSLGRAISPVINPNPEDVEYLLFREENGAVRTDSLYLFGRRIRKTVFEEFSRGDWQEGTEEAGERRVVRYSGYLPRTEDIYRNNHLERSYRYGWDGSRIEFLEMTVDGEQLFHQEYLRDPGGRLRTVIRFENNETVKVLNFGYDSSGLGSTWVGDFESGTQTFFSGLDIISESRMSGTEVVARIQRESRNGIIVEKNYNAENALISTLERTAEGRLLRETLFEDGAVRRDRELRYTGEQLVESVIREPGRLERRLYTYRGNELIREELRVNRRLVMIVLFDGENRIEEYYRQGSLVVRKWYTHGNYLKEELYEAP